MVRSGVPTVTCVPAPVRGKLGDRRARGVGLPVAALLPLILVAVAWIAYCLWDLSRAAVRGLPRWGWALLIILSVPLGGILYFVFGRDQA